MRGEGGLPGAASAAKVYLLGLVCALLLPVSCPSVCVSSPVQPLSPLLGSQMIQDSWDSKREADLDLVMPATQLQHEDLRVKASLGLKPCFRIKGNEEWVGSAATVQ